MKENGDKKKLSDKIWLIIYYVMLSLAIIAVVVSGIYAFSNFRSEISDVKSKTDELTVETVNLRSVAYQNSLSGRFNLGFGTLNGHDYYVCYEVLDDNGIKLLKLDANKTVIYDTITDGEAYAEIESNGWGIVQSIKLYVPTDTIQTEYDFSLL